MRMQAPLATALTKVPAVTLLFWLIKIAATTLGETGGDAVTMSWLGETTAQANANGYLIGTGLFALVFVVAVWLQVRARQFNPWLYWCAILASTRWARPWRILRRAPLELAIAVARPCCWPSSFAACGHGSARWVRCRWPASARHARKGFTG